jgi:hypothetical protein
MAQAMEVSPMAFFCDCFKKPNGYKNFKLAYLFHFATKKSGPPQRRLEVLQPDNAGGQNPKLSALDFGS